MITKIKYSIKIAINKWRREEYYEDFLFEKK